MLYIKKGTEPRELTEYKVQPGANYSDFRDKDAVRKALLAEQGGLCAYCMSRITSDTMKIEHWNAQHALDGSGISTALDYRNMLGVCYGNEGSPYPEQTCDAHRRNVQLHVDPQNQEMIAKIRYQSNGIIFSDDESINNDLNCVLNLNSTHSYLVKNREAAITALQRYLKSRKKDGTWSIALLSKAKEHFESKNDGLYSPYLGAILYFIDHYMKKSR